MRAVTVPERAAAVRPSRPQSRGRAVWARVRSRIALVVLVAVVGAMLAVAVGAVLVGGAIALRNAVS